MIKPLFFQPARRTLLLVVALLLSIGTGFGQAVSVTGRVTGKNGEGIPAATVVVKGTTTGVASDVDGSYALTVPGPGSVLVFSSVGFASQEVAVAGRPVVNVTLADNVSSLDEVVVVGYGTVKKSDLTGSVVSIKEKDLTPGAIVNVQQAIQGRAAGVQVYQKSGEPGSAMSVKIRGASSITAGNDPLYVIDGMPVNDAPPVGGGGVGFVDVPNQRNPLNSLNPNDIESIEILKDASATAIYGSRGSNGVVLITTKRGKGDLKINYSAQYGVQTVANNPKMLTGQQYHDVLNAIIQEGKAAGLNLGEPVPDNVVNTDWQQLLYRHAPTQTHDLSASGGAGNTKYYLSLGYFDQQGILLNSGLKRYSSRLNLENSRAGKYAFGVNLNTSYIKDKYGSVGVGVNENGSALYSAINYDPSIPAYTPEGAYNYARTPALAIDQPLVQVNGQYANSDSYRTFGTVYGEYFVLPALSAKVKLGGDINTSQRNVWVDPSTLAGTQAGSGVATILSGNRNYYIGEGTLNYNRAFETHQQSVSAVLGATYEHFGANSFSASSRGFTLPDLTYNGLGSGNNQLNQVGSGRAASILVSYLGRVNYSVADKYLVTLSMRADGSSRFGPNNRFGYFPSAAVAWKLHQERFLQDVGWLSELKLRGSYGAIGNQSIGNFLFLPTFAYGGNAVFENGPGSTRYPTLFPSRKPNPDLKWEAARQADIGLDFALADARVQGTVEYYDRRTSDLLLNVQLPTSTGFASQIQNVGSVRNTGFELTLSAALLRQKSFSWTLDGNISTLKNRVTSLGSTAPFFAGAAGFLTNVSVIRPGESLGNFYGYQVVGVWQTGDDFAEQNNVPKPGDLKYKDQNGDGLINAADQVVLGKSLPDFTYGITNTLQYKTLALAIFLQGAQGGSVLNNTLVDSYFPLEFRRNKVAEPYLNRWTPDNPTNEYPSFVRPATQGLFRVNSRTVENASYLRLQSVRLSYTVPLASAGVLKAIGVFVTAQNLFTITRYTGTDPAVNAIGDDIIKVDYSSYPLTRTYLAGLNVQF